MYSDPCNDCGNQGLEPLNPIPCTDCGAPCSDCIEPEIIIVRGLPSLRPCDAILNAIQDLAVGVLPCSISVTNLIVSGSTVTVVGTSNTNQLEYSSDGVSWQASASFSNQPCGTNKYYVRQKNYPACLASQYVTLTENCECIPYPKPVPLTPLITQCVGGFKQIKVTDGCGHDTWEQTTQSCETAGCIPNVQDVSPAVTECIGGYINYKTYDGCDTYGYRATTTTCGCFNPVIPSITSAAATCDQAGNSLSNASILIPNVSSGTKYGYSLGTTYNGPAYGSATSVVGNSISITGLSGSQQVRNFTVRVFNTNNDCYTDKTVQIAANICTPPTCVYPQYAFFYVNPTCNGNVASNDGSMRIFANAASTRYQIVQDSSFTLTPNYAAATVIPTNGGAEYTVFPNVGFDVNQQYKDFTIRVYNGSQSCYIDTNFRFFNPCFGVDNCVAPTSSPAAGTPATCTGSTLNNNASIQILGIGTANRYAYSIGTVFSGASYATATPLSSSILTISNLAGSVNATNYVVRLYNQKDTCYLDVPVSIAGTNCVPSCVTPTFTLQVVSPTCTGDTPNYDGILRILNPVNGTRYQLCIDETFSCGNFYNSATPITGSGTITVGNEYTVSGASQRMWIRVYNGSADCYDTKSILMLNNCESCCSLNITGVTLTDE